MPKVILNGIEYASGLDQTTYAKIGDDSLETEAQDLSGATNEHEADISEIKQSLSDLIQYVLIQGTTSSSGALALPSEVVSGAILDMYYEGSGVNGFINRRDKNYLTCYDNNLNIKANTPVKIHCYYTPISQS